ncbi:MAG: signal peptidase I [Clostridiales bacterium]|nr:signal peptidase I [Clostridiales bacterium]
MSEWTGDDKGLPEMEVPSEEKVQAGIVSEGTESAEVLSEEPERVEQQKDTVPDQKPEADEASAIAPAAEETPEKKPAAKSKKKRKKKTAKDFAIEFLIKVAITVAVVVILCVFVVGIHVNHGHSSYPMIKDGDLVITWKLGTPDNGEEIAYKHDGKVKFGRIVAKAGDEVSIENDCVLVNGYNIIEDVVYPTKADGAVISFPYIVPQGTVFVLNDFRSDVGDSRTYGAIPMSDVEGEVIFVLRRRGI